MWFDLEYYRDNAEDTRPTYWMKCTGMKNLDGTYEHVFDRDVGDCDELHTQYGPVLPMGTINWSAYYSPTPADQDQTAQFVVTGPSLPYIMVNDLNYNNKYAVTPFPLRHQICRDGDPSWVYELFGLDDPNLPFTLMPSDPGTTHLQYEFSDSLGTLGIIDTFYQFIRV